MTQDDLQGDTVSGMLDHEAEQVMHEALARFEALQRAARLAASTDTLQTVLQGLVDIAAQAIEADRITLYTFDLIKRKVELVIHGGNHAAPQSSDGDQWLDSNAAWALEAWRPGRPYSETAPRSWPGGGLEPSPWTTITAPMIYSERILGIIKAANPPERSPFVRSDEILLTSLANQAAAAVEMARLRREERTQRKQAETLREVARLLNYSLDQQRVLELILDQLARVVEYDSASIMLLNYEQLSIAAHRKFHTPEQALHPTQLSVYAHIREALERRRPVIIENTEQDPRWQRLPGSGYIKCWLGVPLVGRDQVIGLLNLDKETAGFYTQTDATLASTFASQAAIAIENARLYSAERQRVDQLNALRAIVADISAELELPRLLQSILKRAVSMLNATGGDLGLCAETGQDVIILASYNMGQDYSGVRMALGEGAMGLAAQTRRPVLVDDYTRWENASLQYHTGGWHSVVAVPFLIGRRVVGVIGIVDADPGRRFDASDQHLLSLFAQHAAIAVENARLFMAARQATERRNILHQVSQDIVSVSLEPEGIYQAIHQAAARLMPAEAFVISKLVEGQDIVEGLYLIDRSGRVPSTTTPASQGLSGLVLRTGQSLNIHDLSENEQVKNLTTHFGDPEDVASILAVPMRLRGKVVGMISAQSYHTDAYSDDDQYLLETLAAYAAIALENVGLFKHVQQLAITDPLTELFNRRQLFELGERETLRARRFGRSLSALLLDVDQFKKINDQFSHAVGDEVLRRLGRTVRQHVREIDIPGRYGGEELVVVLPEADLGSAREVAERLRDEIRKCFAGSDLPRVTVSVGAASLQSDTPDFETLIHRADIAMYQAKQKGGNRVEVAR